MKLPKFMRRKKTLRATTARRALALPEEMDYEEMSEPNMKLSRALLIVLVLHVVAVAGIIAFNAIKTRETPLPALETPKTATAASDSSQSNADAAKNSAPTTADADDEARPARNSSTPSTTERKSEHVRATKSAAADSGKTYTVAKGDNPVTIARKFKVPEAELLALNHIDDPHKLQIGRKLLIPAKSAKKKKQPTN